MEENYLMVENGLRSWLINTLNGEIIEIERGLIKENKDRYQLDDLEELKLRDKRINFLDDKTSLEEIKNRLMLINTKIKKIHKKVNFAISYNCNFRCPYCFEKMDKENQIIISRDIIDVVYEHLGTAIKYIGLFGGEPLLNESAEIIKYIYERWPNAIYDITTNGYNIDKFIDVLRKMKIDYVQVTIDGLRERHNKLRIHESGELTYDKIIGNIRLLLHNNIKVVIRINVDEHYIDEVFAQKKELENLFNFNDLISFNIGPLVQLNEAEEERVEALLYEKEAKDRKENSNWDINKGNRYIVYGGMPILKKVLYGVPYRKSFSYCPANTNALYFDAKGEIYSCVGLIGNPQYSIGRIGGNKIVFKQENMFEKNIVNQDKCSKCKYAFLCGGECQMKLQNRRCKRTQYLVNKILPMVLDILF